VAGIVRATALTLLRSPLADADVDSVRAGLTDADALLRIGALRALQSGPSERTVQLAAPLLDDAVRSVRLAAVDLLSPLRQLISVDDRGAFERAEREYIDAQLAIAERPEAIGNLANLLREGGRHASAESYFLHALGEEPAMSSVRANLADLYRELGREQDAETLLRAGIALDENDAALHHSLGLLLVRTGRGDQAMEALERAVELQPDSARFNYVYAIALNSSGRGDAAVALLQDAQTRLPADFDTDYALVTMLLERGDIQGARDAAALLLERYPDDANVRALLQSMPPA
jgi:Flp pilus assembly protein TadD